MRVSCAATVVLAVVLAVVGAPLTTDAAPLGIVSLELAGTQVRAAQVLASWTPDALPAATLVQVLDLPFPVAYGALGLALSRRAGSEGAARAAAAAAALDLFVENPLLDWTLWRGPSALPVAVATLAAAAKFLLLVGAAVGALAAWARRR